MGPQPHRMPLFFHRSFETSCLCLFVFRQRFSGKIIYLSTVPSIDSPARGGRGEMEGRERERELGLPCTFSDTGPVSTNETLVRGFLECSEHNPLCRGTIVFTSACVSASGMELQDPPLPTYLLSLLPRSFK